MTTTHRGRTLAWATALALLAAFGTWQYRTAAAAADEGRAWVKDGARLVDVRTPEEFASGHLPGAINIPVQDLPGRAAEIGAVTERVVVYCRSGNRSARAARLLKEAGFTAVLNGGAMAAWQ